MLADRWKPPTVPRRRPTLARTRHLGDRIGDGLLYGLTAAAAFLGVLVVFAIIWRVADGAWPAIKVFHLDFLWDNVWNAPLERVRRPRPDHRHHRHVVRRDSPRPLRSRSRSGSFSASWRRRGSRTPVGTLVDMLAAVPSVVIGLWGIYVLAPFNAQHVQPAISAVARLAPDLRERRGQGRVDGVQRDRSS